MKQKPLLFELDSSLGPLEETVLQLIWQQERTKVRNVLSALPGKKLAYTTIMTVMDHLYRKGFLNREKAGKTYIYWPIEKRQNLVVRSLVSVFFQIVGQYRLPQLGPIGYSLPLVPVIIFLLMSGVNFIENINSSGVVEYAKLIIAEPFLIMNKMPIFGLALIESLPIASIIAIAVSSAVLVFIVRKLISFFEETSVRERFAI